MSRDQVMMKLSELGIETRPFFVPVNRQPVYVNDFFAEEYPVAEGLSREGLNLPSGNTLNEDQVGIVVKAISSLRR